MKSSFGMWVQRLTMCAKLFVLAGIAAMVLVQQECQAQQAGTGFTPGGMQFVNGVAVQQQYFHGMPQFIPGLMPGEVINLFPQHLVDFTNNVTRPGMMIQESIDRDRRHETLPQYQFTPDTVVAPQFGASHPGARLRFGLRGGRLSNLMGQSSTTVDFLAGWHQLGAEDQTRMQILKQGSAWEFYEDGIFVHTEVGQRERMREGVNPQPMMGRWGVNPNTRAIEFLCDSAAGGTGGGTSTRMNGRLRLQNGRIVADVSYRYAGGAAFSSPYGFAATSSMTSYQYTIELTEQRQ